MTIIFTTLVKWTLCRDGQGLLCPVCSVVDCWAKSDMLCIQVKQEPNRKLAWNCRQCANILLRCFSFDCCIKVLFCALNWDCEGAARQVLLCMWRERWVMFLLLWPHKSGYFGHTLQSCLLQALVYDILPSMTAVFSYAKSPRKLSANEQFFCWCSNSSS